MKVDYLLQLFKSSNKKIWNNKVFSYFLIALVIGFTVILRKLPQIYYKYLLNPVLLLLVVILIILITSHNYSLGIILGVCLIALYYPTQYQYQNTYLETFENENDTIPIEKTDKNIVDDEEIIKKQNEEPTKEPKIENKKTDKKNEEKNIESDAESDAESVNDEESQSEDEKTSDDKKDEKISGMRLENLNPSYYKKKSSNSSSNSSNNKKIVEKFEKNTKPKLNNKSNNKSKSKPQTKEETFLGEVRKVVNDLDTGNNKMNANSAIKKISELMYNKHKTSIQQILNNNDDDDSDETDEDEI